MPCARKVRRMVASHARTLHRSYNSSAISCKLGCALPYDIARNRDMLRLQCRWSAANIDRRLRAVEWMFRRHDMLLPHRSSMPQLRRYFVYTL